MVNDNQSLRPGTVVKGPHLSYTIIKKLGQGGFGITYLVEAPVKVGNIVIPGRFALKEHFISSLCSRESATQTVAFSSPVAAEVDSSMRSFIKEATRLQELSFDHGNIVKINEVFEANNTAYYVMEYLEGETLADYIQRRGPLTFEEASYFLRPVAEAVAELHARRLTHYDIKPANIILASGGEGERPRPVLIDFGLSKHYDREGHATSTTAAGGYSPGYSPVEQYAGIKKFTPQADVYALGATLWHCLKGEAPAESVMAPVNNIDKELAGVASPRLIEAMRHAMANFTDQRTPDAGEFVKEIFGDKVAGYSVTPPPPSVPQPPKPQQDNPSDQNATRLVTTDGSRPWLKWAIAGAAALIGIILAVVLILPGKEKAAAPELVTAALEETPTETARIHPAETQAAEPEVVVEPETSAAEPVADAAYGRTSYNNLDLATIYNGEPRFFSQAEWNAVPASAKSKYTKKGVVVKGGSVPAGKDDIFCWQANPTAGYASDFIVEMYDSSNGTSWNKAVRSYGKRLPDIYQAYLMAKQPAQLNAALKAFGGKPFIVERYWTRNDIIVQDITFGWSFYCVETGLVDKGTTDTQFRVRLVGSVPPAR